MIFDPNDNIYFSHTYASGNTATNRWTFYGFKYTSTSPITPIMFFRSSVLGEAYTAIFGKSYLDLYVGGRLTGDNGVAYGSVTKLDSITGYLNYHFGLPQITNIFYVHVLNYYTSGTATDYLWGCAKQNSGAGDLYFFSIPLEINPKSVPTGSVTT